MSMLAHANGSIDLDCSRGYVNGSVVGLSTLFSNSKITTGYPACTVTVYLHDTSIPARIYSEDGNSPIPLENPFTATANGHVKFYANQGRYDVTLSGAGFSTPYKINDVYVFDGSFQQNIRVACSPSYGFPSHDVGYVINAAIASLPPSGGIVDAGCFMGVNNIITAMTIGSPTKPVILLLGMAIFNASATIIIGNHSSVSGVPGGQGYGNTGYSHSSVIRMADNSNLATLISIVGNGASLQSLTVDGNAPRNPMGGNPIRITGVGTNLENIDVMNGSDTNILALEGAGHLTKVISSFSLGSCFEVRGKADWFVLASEFEICQLHGIKLSGGGNRIEASDIGGNGQNRGGLPVAGLEMDAGEINQNSTGNIIIGNQFGNQFGHDLVLNGYNTYYQAVSGANTVITGNSFIGSSNFQSNTYDAIHIVDSGSNAITGNAIITEPPSFSSYKNGISIQETVKGRAGYDTIIGNTIQNWGGTHAIFTNTDKTLMCGNPNWENGSGSCTNSADLSIANSMPHTR